jgi:hypothetical protein
LYRQNGGFTSGFATKIQLGFVISPIKATSSSRLYQPEHHSIIIIIIIILHELGLDTSVSATAS